MKGCNELGAEMTAGCLKDIGRYHFFTQVGEIDGVLSHCEHNLSNLDKYMADVHFDPALAFAPNTNTIRYEPLGVALIMGSWNYPYFVCLKPLV